MAKIWVHINPIVTADGGGAKTAFTTAAETQLVTRLAADVEAELPAKLLSTDDADKPKGKPPAHSGPGAHNAIKVTATLTLGIETDGKKLTVAHSLKIEFEAIKYPNLKPGMLLVSGRSSTTLDGRGTDAKALLAIANEALDHLSKPLVKQLAKDPRLISNGKMHGIPFD